MMVTKFARVFHANLVTLNALLKYDWNIQQTDLYHLRSIATSFYSFPPALAMASIIRSRNLKPYYLVHPNCLPDLPPQVDDQNFDSVVLGDAVDGFSYKNINEVIFLFLNLKMK